MDYKKQHLRSWLLERPLIKIEALELEAGCPKATIRHFIKERRNISTDHLESVSRVLSNYGFVAMGDE